jgi:hypothetical protein
MAVERIRQVLSGPLEMDRLEQYQKEGWRVVAMEWEREVVDSTLRPAAEAPPYGLQVAKDCATLVENPSEAEILVTMMELIIQDGPYSFIAEELNRRGHLTRQGGRWSAVAVFEMLPRLIEAGPKIFSSADWHQRRQRSREQAPRLPV